MKNGKFEAIPLYYLQIKVDVDRYSTNHEISFNNYYDYIKIMVKNGKNPIIKLKIDFVHLLIF